MLDAAIKRIKILFESAQGTLLTLISAHILVTSSNPIAGGVEQVRE